MIGIKIFIAGPRSVSKLNLKVATKLDNIINNDFTVLVGDANGVDKAIQKYCNEKEYGNVIVYATGKHVRNNIGNWKTVNVEAPKNVKGFDFYALKDRKMAMDCDYGLMVWNGKSKGTFNNIINLVSFNKTVFLYFIPDKRFYKIENMKGIEELVNLINNKDIKEFFIEKITEPEQLTLEI